MRKLIYLFFSILVCAACELHTSENGDLDGYWQLRSVDTLSSGNSCDMRDSMIFWSFEVNLMHMRDNKIDYEKVFMRFDLLRDTMMLYKPIIDMRDSSDIILTDFTILHHYGIHDVPETFKVETLNSSTMILKNKVLRLNFRKY